ncbi:MAG: hypothetical protein C0501_22495 [Isosphaera sp.]|nr:hypothetical protein [Isosphaera sp.]
MPHSPPPCTPELQPVEAFRPLVREAVAARSIRPVDRLRAVRRSRLADPAQNPRPGPPAVGRHQTRRPER